MENLRGLLRIHVKRGINLAVRDLRRTSDPYVIVKMGKQKVKTRVVKNSINPQWNDDLTLPISDPILPIKLKVYDRDTFSRDDKMGEAEIDIKLFIEALKLDLDEIPSGTIISKVEPNNENDLSRESYIIWANGKLFQNMILKLRNVERGEIEIQLHWIPIPNSKGL